MLRPEPMARVLVAGPKDELERVIESLYALELVHLVDHRADDPEITIGKPLPRASAVSEDLVKLRSIASILKVEEAEEPEDVAVSDLRAQVMTLDVNLREQDEARKKIEALLQDLDRRIEGLGPFASLGLALDAYRGYDSIEPVVGRVRETVRGLDAVAPEHEIVQAESALAVFVPKERADAVREFLAPFGFSPTDVPEGEGDPAELLARAKADREKWVARRAEVEERIAKLRNRYAKFVVKAEDQLQVEIEKAEAPLRFATSEHSFVIDGWVPASRIARLKEALAAMPAIYVEAVEEGQGQESEAEKPPVLLRNRGPARRFEFLTNLYSTPQHDEADPTAFMFLLFPVFFGLMIGDAGYGIVMIILGFTLSAKFRKMKELSDLMRVVLYGGFFAYIFGMLLYGEIFGIPFHAPEGSGEVDWTAILGYNIPYSPPIHKLESVGVIDLLLLSVVASSIHLGLGYVVGFANEWKHSKRHAFAKIGWLLILIGFLAFFAVLARTPDWCATSTDPGCGIASHRVVNQLFFDQPPLAWIPAEGLAFGGMTLPYFMLGSIIAGAGILIVAEPMGAMEIISLLANMMSYTRLAGVAVAKGAVALAFNTMFLPLIINEELFLTPPHLVQLNPNIAFVILGFILMFLAHAMVLILGAISAGIQSIRLNYVEFFLKFFKGGGILFSPFGARKSKAEA